MRQKTEPVVVFLAFANERVPGGRYLRNLPDEARRLRAALDPVQDAGHCKVELRQGALLGEFVDVLQKYRNSIALFHFGGHAGTADLLFESSDGGIQLAHAAGLVGLLGEQLGLQLVFLNGCSSAGHVKGLLSAGVPAVLATSEFIDDAVAAEFSATFYRSLATGAPLSSAYKEAQAAIVLQKGDLPREAYSSRAEPPDASRWPWELHIASGAGRQVEDWTLTGATKDPYFGLPPIPPIDLPSAPFKNLERFTRQDASIFFGRGWEIREIYQVLSSEDGCPIVLLYGATGVGKSSLLAAGLCPRLEAFHEMVYLRRDPTKGLAASLRAAFGGPADLREAWHQREAERPAVVILDQVEEAWTNPVAGGSEIEELTESLRQIFGVREERPRGRLLLSFRKEWLAEVREMLDQSGLPWQPVALWPLNREGICEAMTGPEGIQSFHLEVDKDLPGLVANQLLEDPGAAIAPALQILLTKLWRQVEYNREPRFTTDLYRRVSRKGRWLDQFFDEQLKILRDRREKTVTSGLALDLLAYHTTPLGTAASRPMASVLKRYGNERRRLVTELVLEFKSLYLLSDPAHSEEKETSRLAHDVLAPIVRKRFDRSDRPGQRARRILQNRQVEWSEGEEGAPLDETDLKLVEEGLRGMRSLQAHEERLLAASRRALEARRKARRKATRLRRVGRLAILFLLTAGSALAVLASYDHVAHR